MKSYILDKNPNSKNKLILSFFIVLVFIVIIALASFKLKSDDIAPKEFFASGFDSDVKIAFLGDQGVNQYSKAVLELAKRENVELVVHQGDLGYNETDPTTPQKWEDMINAILGEDFPYIASIGNHDIPQWLEYSELLDNRLKRTPEVECEGTQGIQMTCRYKGILFVLSGIGTNGENHENYLESKLSETSENWKICSWHKTQGLMEPGGQGNLTGWDVYEICRKYGAIVATGHEHSYARTHLLSNFTSQEIVSTDNNLVLKPGQTFAFVSGLGGKSIRNEKRGEDSNLWWASIYTARAVKVSTEHDTSIKANYGALFCNFFKDGKQNEAECYFKDIDGNIPDRFTITSQLNSESELTVTQDSTSTVQVSATNSSISEMLNSNIRDCGLIDTDNNLKIDIQDFTNFKNNYLSTCNSIESNHPCGSEDFNNDGIIDIKDFKNFIEKYNKSCI